jgi:hypothetical protein
MPNGVSVTDIVDVTVLIFAGVEHDRLFHLLAPSQLFLSFNAVHEGLHGISLLLRLGIGYELHNAHFLFNFDGSRGCLEELDAKKFDFVVFVSWTRWNRNYNVRL